MTEIWIGSRVTPVTPLMLPEKSAGGNFAGLTTGRDINGKGNTDVGGAAFDVNGDGWIDVVAGSKLLLNPGEPKRREFAVFEIGTFIHTTPSSLISTAMAEWI